MLRTRTNDTLDVVKVDHSNLASFNYSTYKPTLIKVENIVDPDIGVFGQTLLFTPTALYTNSGKVNGYYTIFNGTILQLYRRGATTVIQRYNTVNEHTFEDLVKSTPTDVRLVEDQGKLQLQLEHDSEVLSIDKGVNDLLGTKFGYDLTIGSGYNGEMILTDGDNDEYVVMIYGDFAFEENPSDITLQGLNLNQLFGQHLGNQTRPLTIYAYSVDQCAVGVISFNRVNDGYVCSFTDTEFQALNEVKVSSYNFVNKHTGEEQVL